MPVDLLIGRQIASFRIERLLGRGGMAVVYYGWDTALERPVAFKVIDARFREDPFYTTRFVREARSVARWQHENIVKIYQAGEEDGLYYFAMEYVTGQDLGKWMAKHHSAPIENAEILRIGRAVTSALDYAHGQGIIHRDIKPANILLAEDGRVVLTDFGLAMDVVQGSVGEAFGSAHYIAPEQARRSADAVPQSDLYSFGIVLYEMLTGRVPFDDASPTSVALQHVTQNVPSPREFNPDLSPETERVLLKALSKPPQDRYLTGQALMEALVDALQQTSVGDVQRRITLPPPPARAIPPPTAQAELPVINPLALPSPPIPAPKRGKRSLLRVAFGVFLLTLVFLGGWFTFVERRISLPAGFSVPGLAVAPTASPTPTYPPSRTPPPIETLTPEFVFRTPPSPTETATQTLTPSPTRTPSPSPLFTSSPSPIPLLIFTREQDEMPVIQIPAGTFQMGANPDDSSAHADERPQHPVMLDSFNLDQYEVSVAQYAAFLTENGGHAPSACLGFTCVKTNFEALDSHLVWNGGTIYESEAGFENYPINFVTWFGAKAYCEWVGGRLPTEAEWEYAARGTDGRQYPWGDAPADETRAIFDLGFNALLPVDALPDGASAFEIYSMAGSLWEWTADWYAEDYYADSPDTNPTGPAEGAYRDPRVLRGGGWDSLPEDLRATARQDSDPLNGDAFGANVGFRCAMEGGTD